MKFFDPEDGAMAEACEAIRGLEKLLFPDGKHGTCGICNKTVPKWGMVYNTRTAILSCGDHKA